MEKKVISGWGKNINILSNIFYPKNINEILEFIKSNSNFKSITRGLGRSYGDSSLNCNSISLQKLEKFFYLDENSGLLECSANFSIDETLELIVEKGWFLNVTPGSKYVTLGGAIASDVHGKNHHIDGTFCDYVESFKIILSDGKIYNCSNKELPDLFHSTCGGMGLTGIILSAKIRLLKINSNLIDVKIFKTKNLKQTIELFDELKENKYLVAWIDSTSKKEVGRSILFAGSHSINGNLNFVKKKKISLPGIFPGFLLNNFIIKLLNKLFYIKHKNNKSYKQNIDEFFYPLDKILNCNNFYGKKGFVQIQILINNSNYEDALKEILFFFQKNNQFSFITTLKKLKSKNKNLLSFPNEGFTITFDFKVNEQLKITYKKLEKILKKFDAKIYLTKDSLMSEEFFVSSYENLDDFRKIKKKYDQKDFFTSIQSERLGIT